MRPGSSYLNLNPYEVLQIDIEAPVEDIRKKYKKLSILVHPDKNSDDKERAEKAFEIVNKAWKLLENEGTRKRCLEIYEEAKQKTDMMISEKRKKLKREGRGYEKIPEDDPAQYKHCIYVAVMKLFADLERKRQQLEQRDLEERKRKREQEIEEEEQRELQKEFAKNFEESREARVSSWQKFQSGEGKKSKKAKKAPTSSTFQPPKVKAETRN